MKPSDALPHQPIGVLLPFATLLSFEEAFHGRRTKNKLNLGPILSPYWGSRMFRKNSTRLI